MNLKFKIMSIYSLVKITPNIDFKNLKQKIIDSLRKVCATDIQSDSYEYDASLQTTMKRANAFQRQFWT